MFPSLFDSYEQTFASFLVVGLLRFYPPYTNGLGFLVLARTDFDNFFFFFQIFGLKRPDFRRRKKSGFLLSGQWGLPYLFWNIKLVSTSRFITFLSAFKKCKEKIKEYV